MPPQKCSINFLVFIVACVLLLIFIIGTYLPANHFTSNNVPVLTTAKNPNDTTLSNPYSTKSFNILLLGIDARKEEKSRTDVIMLVNINPLNRKVVIISIPRDTRVELKEIGFTKINHAHLLAEIEDKSGTIATIEAVSSLCNCNINYYVKTNFSGFEHFIDTIGGLDIKLPEPVKLTYSDITIPSEITHINGDLTLQLVRERQSLQKGDFSRQRNQYTVLKAIAKKLLNPKFFWKIPGLYNIVQKDIIDTNFSENDILSLAWLFQGLESEDISYIQIPGKNGYEFDPLVNMELYFWIPDLSGIKILSDKYLSNA